MTNRALNFLAAIAIASLLGLTVLGVVDGDQAQAENTLSHVLVGSVTAIAALVAPAAARPPGQ